MRTDPRPTARTIAAYYPEDYGPHRHAGDVGKSPRALRVWWKRLLIQAFDSSSRKIPKLMPGQVLEIGCATGDFLADMSAKGWLVQGLEFSRRAARIAIDQGFPVQVSTVDEAQYPRESFDLIVGWMVLEHLHHPITSLQRLCTWAKPGGWLALSVPDAGSWEFRTFRDRWYALQVPTHLFHYERRSLQLILKAGGWKVHRVFWHRNPANLLISLKYLCSDHGWNRVAALLSAIAEDRRYRYLRALLGFVLAAMRSSGRMTVWAQKI